MNKSTLICMHVLPTEIEMFDRFMCRYKEALKFLDSSDNITFRFTLNLNPELTNWNASKLKQGYFMDIFYNYFNGISNINEVTLDDSVWGTTQQKRDSIKLDYDQFIFCDSDIVIHPHLLKLQLLASYNLDGMYIISPSIPRWWDITWDILVDSRFKQSNIGTFNDESVLNNIHNQNTDNITIKNMNTVKFGCGMHTLYSKSFWNFIQIPESFRGYGPEDSFAMSASSYAKQRGYPIFQYRMDGIYITEDYHNRTPSIINDLVVINRKDEFYKNAFAQFNKELDLFISRI